MLDAVGCQDLSNEFKISFDLFSMCTCMHDLAQYFGSYGLLNSVVALVL